MAANVIQEDAANATGGRDACADCGSVWGALSDRAMAALQKYFNAVRWWPGDGHAALSCAPLAHRSWDVGKALRFESLAEVEAETT